MRFVIDAAPEDAPAVLAKAIDELPAFMRQGPRVGWGWVHRINGRDYFIRATKTGLSARPVEQDTP